MCFFCALSRFINGEHANGTNVRPVHVSGREFKRISETAKLNLEVSWPGIRLSEPYQVVNWHSVNFFLLCNTSSKDFSSHEPACWLITALESAPQQESCFKLGTLCLWSELNCHAIVLWGIGKCLKVGPNPRKEDENHRSVAETQMPLLSQLILSVTYHDYVHDFFLQDKIDTLPLPKNTFKSFFCRESCKSHVHFYSLWGRQFYQPHLKGISLKTWTCQHLLTKSPMQPLSARLVFTRHFSCCGMLCG